MHIWSWCSVRCMYMPEYFVCHTTQLHLYHAWDFKLLFQHTCMSCLHVELVSEGRGAWASGAAENLSPSCQEAFKVFSSCSSGCSQPRPHPHVIHCYVTVPAGCTKGTHSDSDRHWMIQREWKSSGGKGGMQKKKEDGSRAEGKTDTGISHNSHVLFHCQLENKENIELVDIQAWS